MYLLTIYLLDIALVGSICHYKVEIEFDDSSSILVNFVIYGIPCYYYLIIANDSTFSNPAARNDKDQTNQISNTTFYQLVHNIIKITIRRAFYVIFLIYLSQITYSIIKDKPDNIGIHPHFNYATSFNNIQ